MIAASYLCGLGHPLLKPAPLHGSPNHRVMLVRYKLWVLASREGRGILVDQLTTASLRDRSPFLPPPLFPSCENAPIKFPRPFWVLFVNKEQPIYIVHAQILLYFIQCVHPRAIDYAAGVISVIPCTSTALYLSPSLFVFRAGGQEHIVYAVSLLAA